MYFRIVSENFTCDKYYTYSRLCLDDPFLKNNCTYEIIRQKKIKKRVKLFNFYTPLIVLGFLALIIGWITSSLTLEAFIKTELLQEWTSVIFLILWGVCGRIRVRRRYKKVTKQQYIHDCFGGRVEESKLAW